MSTRKQTLLAVATLTLFLLFAWVTTLAIRNVSKHDIARVPAVPSNTPAEPATQPANSSGHHAPTDAYEARASATPARDAHATADPPRSDSDPRGNALPSATREPLRLAFAPTPHETDVPELPHGVASPVATPAASVAKPFCPSGTTLVREGDAIWCSRGDAAGIAVKDGPYESKWSNGKRRAEGAFRQGKRDGAWREWYATGVTASQGAYREGRREGPWTFWRETGAKAEAGTYVADVKEGRWTVFDDAGHRAAEGTLRTDGMLTHEVGVWVYYWPNGVKREQGEFRAGRREGKWTEFASNGRLESASLYVGGEKDLRP